MVACLPGWVIRGCGQHGLAALYAGGSVALGLVGLFGGMKLARLVLG